MRAGIWREDMSRSRLLSGSVDEAVDIDEVDEPLEV